MQQKGASKRLTPFFRTFLYKHRTPQLIGQLCSPENSLNYTRIQKFPCWLIIANILHKFAPPLSGHSRNQSNPSPQNFQTEWRVLIYRNGEIWKMYCNFFFSRCLRRFQKLFSLLTLKCDWKFL